MIDHIAEVINEDFTAEEYQAWRAFCRKNNVQRFTKLEKSSFVHGYRAAKAANKGLLEELLEAYSSVTNSAYCQVPVDEVLTAKVRNFLGETK